MTIYSLISAFLFALSIPFSKILLNNIPAFQLTSILYFSSFVFLFVLKTFKKNLEPNLKRKDIPYLIGSIIFGGFLGPVFMIFALKYISASAVSLFANFEMIFTVTIAIIFLGESKDFKFFLGFSFIFIGVVILNFNFNLMELNLNRGVLFVLLSSFFWALDNNFTAKISISDPITITMFKGLGGGILSFTAGYLSGNIVSFSLASFIGGVITGILSYALSLVFLIYSIRYSGVSHTFAIFNSYPLFAYILSMIIFKESLTFQVVSAFALVAAGMWFVIFSKHKHAHTHIIEHEHFHSHNDGHHDHDHNSDIKHSHTHAHNITHSHPHYNDIHHTHH
ncbi:MAG TPA: DMT family transporter [Elusimicrobiales bacterium]|nr:DMT family transporter [Elusimicrobiales bacterium]